MIVFVLDERIHESSEQSTDILLADYRYLADSFWRNEEAGEKRVNFFISLVTAVLAALVALATKRRMSRVPWIFGGGPGVIVTPLRP